MYLKISNISSIVLIEFKCKYLQNITLFVKINRLNLIAMCKENQGRFKQLFINFASSISYVTFNNPKKYNSKQKYIIQIGCNRLLLNRYKQS